MKFVSFQLNGNESYGVITEDGNAVWNIPAVALQAKDLAIPATLLEGIQQGEEFFELVETCLTFAKELEETKDILLPIEGMEWLSPITRPKKNIMCVGKNYRDHAIEMGSEKDIPEDVMIFTKSPTSATGHNQTLLLHENITSQLDYEGELAVVIGKKGKGIKEEDALDYVFGYTILNDITARDLQKKHKQFFIGKSLDTSCPMGPYLVTKDEIEDPQKLNIRTTVNGEIRQDSNTSSMIFSVASVISTLSQGMVLEPGDIIATGTPAGVGKGFEPPKFLKSGDEIEISIDRLGNLKNKVK
ncbi:fumarylacetoacetate hydrolase family protein [Bacillus seohaeanensis]|jgi:2-keto-4-pentenoate hydratase/2-oxohepta-3-ene-1,7-dioic acid hydratase in catechol pathway|uniref:Fumarylacetoacetate hydrolase family protein n=1 Tax=Bacillus seohaeanensis TaxID=284580 RepID=A0ABW5RS61_9BACI